MIDFLEGVAIGVMIGVVLMSWITIKWHRDEIIAKELKRRAGQPEVRI